MKGVHEPVEIIPRQNEIHRHSNFDQFEIDFSCVLEERKHFVLNK